MAPRIAKEEVEEAEPIEEIVWDPRPVLSPGMDYKDGVAYFTNHFRRNVVVHGKKDEPNKIVEQDDMMTITSKRAGIWYNAEKMANHGFAVNPNIIVDTQSRWSEGSRKGYLMNGATAMPTKELFDKIKAIYKTYVEFADEIFYDIMPLFIMYTYIYRLFESTGYIHFNGTRASGKSRNLSILNVLCFNTTLAASMSAASMYRKLEGSPGTTILDETEGFDGERGEDLRRILNAGYKVGEKVTRTEKGANDKFVTVSYDVFGPKVLASIKTLEDTIQSRCVVVTMRPTIRDIPDFLSSDPKWTGLRDELYIWALGNMQAIDELRIAWVTEKKRRLAPKVISRSWETTAQYIIMADYIGGEEMAKQMVTYFETYFAERSKSLDATDRLRTTLRALPRVIATKQPHPDFRYSTKDIHEVIASYMESDSVDYFKTRHVVLNLNVLGFRDKIRSKGGVQIKLEEETIRNEMKQRQVEPFEEDVAWLEGKTSYQDGTHHVEEVIPDKEEGDEWWNNLEATETVSE